MATFSIYNSTSQTASTLLSALIPNAAIQVSTDSIRLTYGYLDPEWDYVTSSYITTDDVSIGRFSDGISAIGLESGIILSTGSANPNLSNTESSYGYGFSETIGEFSSEDQLAAIVNAAFSSQPTIYDTTALEFTFTISDSSVQGIRFDLVFASDEFPEWADSSFVDIGAVLVNGVNYALFNNAITQPLSILGNNIASGNFINNEYGVLPIEYDGVSPKLTITAPVQQGLNTISIAVADTGDSAYDSAIFISDLTTTGYAGTGVAPVVTIEEDGLVFDDLEGNQYFDIPTGYFTQIDISELYGDDIFDAMDSYALINMPMTLSDLSGYSFEGDELVLNTPYGTKTISGPDIIAMDDVVAAFDTTPGGETYDAMSLLYSALGSAPDTDTLSSWVAQALSYDTTAQLGSAMIDFYTGGAGVSDEFLVEYLYQNLFDEIAPDDLVTSITSMMGTGQTFETQGDLFAFVAALPQVGTLLEELSLLGSLQVLNPDIFWANY